FPSSERSARRILQMGEEPWRVHAVGDPALDQFTRGTRAGVEELERDLGFRPDRATLLVTFHPATLDGAGVAAQADELVAALRAHAGTIVVTAPAPDPGAERIRAAVEQLARERGGVAFVESLGSHRYRGLMALAGAMVGNSSSGLNEAPCAELPVVNVGDRQAGRDRAANVLDVAPERQAIAAGIARALDPAFRASLAGLRSPYGDGHTAARVLRVLAELPPRERLLRKHFVEPSSSPPPSSSSTGSRVRPLGGDWPLETAWPLDGDAAAAPLFAAARDALWLIARRRPGVWLVPEFTCPVVPETLRAAGATVRAYRWRTPWTVDAEALRAAIVGAGAAGVVVPFYLGLAPDDDVWRALDGAAACVVEDRAQCVGPPPAPPSLRGDFAVGSFRKWVGVADGAWCVARRGDAPAPERPPAEAMARLRSAAGLARRALDGGGDSVELAAVALFRAGELEAGRGELGRRASPASERALASIDYDRIRARRLRNQAFLVERLARASPPVELWQPREGALAGATPLLALPLLAGDRDRLRARLAERRVFCAVHWSDGDWSSAGGAAASWAARQLSLPIDQRLEPADLERIVEALG
ncbi:MAG TPA: UDP-N-acetylglucosamine 2-epimerase, partial [Polyangia bacterium]|nr:UDP-N-acetylglucosamine 2-epimerase [Polyangia bacterium]